MNTYLVLREHEGDRRYYPGDTRQEWEHTVHHLVQHGVLSLQAAPVTEPEPVAIEPTAEPEPKPKGRGRRKSTGLQA